jgi:hypothetical protein
MPHDAALFATSVKQWKSPAQTEAANAAAVTAAQAEYANSEGQAVHDYKVLAGLSPVAPVLTTLTPATIVKGTGTHSVAVVGTLFKAGMKILWDGVLLTPTALTATTCTVTPTKSATSKTVNVYAINYDGTLEARSNAKTFSYTDVVAVVMTNSNTKAEIIAWLLDNGVALDEAALNSLNKSELLDLVEALLDDD